METIHYQVHQIKEAADDLLDGEVVAFPTETVYGLGADATNEEAVRKIFIAKGRPIDNPLIIHIADEKQLAEYVESIPFKAKQVIEHFWPGPCTLILKKKGPLALSVTGGLDTVGVRMPDNSVALDLIRAAKVPLAAPSANTSGKPSPTKAEHVLKDLNGKIKAVIDGGQTGVGLESTVLDLTDPDKPTILRPGGVSLEELERVIGKVYSDTHLSDVNAVPKSPGMKYRHYSPEKPVWILPQSIGRIENLISQLESEGEIIGIIISEDTKLKLNRSFDNQISLGEKSNPERAAAELYSSLRAMDEMDISLILVESYEKNGIGTAYMNRLEKAASKNLMDY